MRPAMLPQALDALLEIAGAVSIVGLSRVPLTSLPPWAPTNEIAIPGACNGTSPRSVCDG